MKQRAPKRTAIAVVGCGSWGTRLVRALEERPDAQVVGVVDLDPARLDAIRSSCRPGTTLTIHPDALWSDPALEAVVIATPTSTHAALAEAALRAGKHVYVEKLLAVDTSSARRLVALAQARGRVLVTGLAPMHGPVMDALDQMLRRGTIGPVRHFRAVRTNLRRFQQDVDVLWDLIPHDLALACHLAGHDSLQVRARLAGPPNLPAAASVWLEFAGGMTAHLYASWVEPEPERCWVITGESAMVRCVERNRVRRLWSRVLDLDELEGDVDPEALLQPEALDGREPLHHLLDGFIAACRRGRSPLLAGVEAIERTAILQAAACSSAAGGEWVQVPRETWTSRPALLPSIARQAGSP